MTPSESRFWHLGAVAPAICLLLFSLLFLWPVTLGGEAFVPARLLRHVAPWSASYAPADRPPWNPLMYDSVGQFYPWRAFAARTYRTGYVPLWNPYQFCGAPFGANSQSAILYPPNLLFLVLGPMRAPGWIAVLHLWLAALFTWMLMRRLGTRNAPAMLAAVAYAFSLWQVAWLHLPTFLATSCWLPLVILLTLRVWARPAASRIAGLGLAIGMALLGGHMQIAFYVLLAAALLATGLAVRRAKELGARQTARRLASWFAACVIGAMLAAPQIVPALELSRQSHRVGKPTAAGYAAYTAYAVHPAALATAFAPDTFGNPQTGTTPYFGFSRGGMYFNYAEGALYTGALALLLAAYAVVRRRQSGRLLVYFVALGVLALLIALGTPIDAVLYFHVPGFGQSGSPGRALVLWAFAVACLAGLGLDKLTRDEAAPVRTAAVVAVAVIAAGGALCAACSAYARAALSDPSAWDPQLARQAGLFVLSGGCLVALAAGKLRSGLAAVLPVALLAVDLFANGALYNPTAPANEVYRSASALDEVRRICGHDRVAPVNRSWSFGGPQAVLPPNGATELAIHDVQGYDSLFPGRYKAFLNRLNGEDSSPREVGNMVFVKNPGSPLLAKAGVRVLMSLTPQDVPGSQIRQMDGLWIYYLPDAPGRATAVSDAGAPIAVRWVDDGATRVTLETSGGASGTLRLADEWYPGWEASVDGKPADITVSDEVFRSVRVPAGRHTISFVFAPISFRVGLFAMLLAIAACAAVWAASASRRWLHTIAGA